CNYADTMADVNVNAPTEQVPLWHHPIVPMIKSCLAADGDTTRYICQLDEKWFDLTKDTLRYALQITPVNNNNPFSSPSTPDALINFINNLGYPKTSGFERPRAPVLQILWGIVNRAHIDYAERMWEEFTQSIHSFVEDKKNLALHTQGKKKANPIVIPSIRFTKLIIHHLQSKHKFHPRLDSPLHLPYEEYILGYLKFSTKGTKREEYLEKVAKHQRYHADKEGSDPECPVPKLAKATKKSKPSAPKASPVTKPVSAQQPKPKPAPTKSQEKKRKLVTKTSDKPSLAKCSKLGGIKFKEYSRCTSGSASTSGHWRTRLLEISTASRGSRKGKGEKLGLADSDSEFDEEVPLVVKVRAQDEGQAGPNPGATDVSTQLHPEQMDEGFTATVYPNIQENLKLTVEEQVILEEPASSTGTLSSLQHLAIDFNFGDMFFHDKPSEA
nr:hypothetical protein [Tanacetum cinerariifolium]GEX76157.1 hypothetical protein [Tanacetum cinerariifolium]